MFEVTTTDRSPHERRGGGGGETRREKCFKEDPVPFKC